jgi:hypothetical protein
MEMPSSPGKVSLRELSALALVSELFAKANDHCFDILILLLTAMSLLSWA